MERRAGDADVMLLLWAAILNFLKMIELLQKHYSGLISIDQEEVDDDLLLHSRFLNSAPAL